MKGMVKRPLSAAHLRLLEFCEQQGYPLALILETFANHKFGPFAIPEDITKACNEATGYGDPGRITDPSGLAYS